MTLSGTIIEITFQFLRTSKIQVVKDWTNKRRAEEKS